MRAGAPEVSARNNRIVYGGMCSECCDITHAIIFFYIDFRLKRTEFASSGRANGMLYTMDEKSRMPRDHLLFRAPRLVLIHSRHPVI